MSIQKYHGGGGGGGGVRQGDCIGVQDLVVKDACSLTPRPRPVCDTETNPYWDWSGTETKMLILAPFSVHCQILSHSHKTG